MSITELVKDWGGFEKLIAKLNDTGSVTVQHNVTLMGRSGAPRQIDVLITHKQGLYKHLVVAECKYWNSNVERLHVDALATTIREVGASRGVIFSMKGFQSGALIQAKHDNIDLFKVRELKDEEWGLPGRVVDIILQLIQPSIGKPDLPDAKFLPFSTYIPPAIELHLAFGAEGPISCHPIMFNGEDKGDTLEKTLIDTCQKALNKFLPTVFTVNGGTEGTSYMSGRVNVKPETPLHIRIDTGIVILEKVSFEMGIKITQSRILIDRAKNFIFSLAVENCITGIVSAASRREAEEFTHLMEIIESSDVDAADTFKNGSVLRVHLAGFFPYEETRGLEPVASPFANEQ